MAKRAMYMIIDCETTNQDRIYDFAAVICDRNGKVYHQMAVILNEFADQELFYNPADSGIWGKAAAIKKKEQYANMLKTGERNIASVAAVNNWINRAIGQYGSALTWCAYNKAFDEGKCRLSGINAIDGIANSFCLWHLACELWAYTKDYKNFALQNNYFSRTEKNATIRTNAEIMGHYIKGEYSDEPHTALLDILDYEKPILVAALKKKNWKEKLGIAYNWRKLQLRDHFVAK